jgi:hypothetical protein
VIPVANEYSGWRCERSMTPPEGYQGVHAVLDKVEGLKRFVSIKKVPITDLTSSGDHLEMLHDPGKEITTSFATSDRGRSQRPLPQHSWQPAGFAEVRPGEVNFAKAMMTYKEVG